MTWRAQAPSNLALIKYMGKTDASNQPLNTSLSWTMSNLISEVVLTESAQTQWRPLDPVHGTQSMSLSETGRNKFLKHFDFLCRQWGVEGSYEIASRNNFPSDCGLASSASSFAALTLATYKLACERGSKWLDLNQNQLAALSRQGSGSSCRSFFAPWAIWDEQGARAIELPVKEIIHHVVVVSRDKKGVSSSQAHQRVQASPLLKGRAERAHERLHLLLNAFEDSDWRSAYEVVWGEFWDMHVLFETSSPPFGYMTARSLAVLEWCRAYWDQHDDGPLVTMDAGPNVHVLFRPDQLEIIAKLKGHFGDMVL